MNDFTKDELKDMLLIFNESIIEHAQPPCIHVLRNKIESMIDSYCKHEHKQYDIGDQRPCILSHECIKCGKIYGDYD